MSESSDYDPTDPADPAGMTQAELKYALYCVAFVEQLAVMIDAGQAAGVILAGGRRLLPEETVSSLEPLTTERLTAMIAWERVTSLVMQEASTLLNDGRPSGAGVGDCSELPHVSCLNCCAQNVLDPILRASCISKCNSPAFARLTAQNPKLFRNSMLDPAVVFPSPAEVQAALDHVLSGDRRSIPPERPEPEDV